MDHADDGLSADVLKLLGYAFVLGALVAWGLLTREVGTGFTSAAGFWLAAGVVCTVAAGTCGVVVAVKRAEARLMAHLHHPAPGPTRE